MNHQVGVSCWCDPAKVLTRSGYGVVVHQERPCNHEWGGAYTDLVYDADKAGYVDLPDGRSIAVGLGHTLTVAVPQPGTFACSKCGAVR